MSKCLSMLNEIVDNKFRDSCGPYVSLLEIKDSVLVITNSSFQNICWDEKL